MDLYSTIAGVGNRGMTARFVNAEGPRLGGALLAFSQAKRPSETNRWG